MNRKKRIIDKLSQNFNKSAVKVFDNSHEHSGHNSFDGTQESHFKVHIKKEYLESLSRLEIHKKINDLLIDEFNSGLHALEINIIN